VRNPAFVVDYIARQKEHHADNRLEAYLEHLEDTNQPLLVGLPKTSPRAEALGA